uniref:Uncharacterized protein n=1 Tax=Rousettus aegyptiacus TaxID=9407 RepID=A0A7J8CI91_ROUAE|nr:hypothetical protein HJG63_009073 [Rousettus aegyptiacus]
MCAGFVCVYISFQLFWVNAKEPQLLDLMVRALLPFIALNYSIIWLCPILIYPFISGWTFGLFPPFDSCITTMNIFCTTFVWTYIFIPLGYVPRSAVAKSYGNCMPNFLRNCQDIFKSNRIILNANV